MRKTFALMMAAASLTALAAQNDTLLTFSTKGPDTYANGDAVADGECYAVVWTKAGQAFAGFEANGVAKGDLSKVVLTAPVAKGGRCPTTHFQIGYKTVAALGAGTYGVYLLDTRDVSGKPQGTVRKDGVWVAKAINSWGAITDATTDLSGGTTLASSALASAADGTTAAVASALPADVPQPRITDVKVDGDQVKITVADTASYLQYTLEQGRTPDALERDDGIAAQGNGDVITITRPATPGGAFFKVIRN